MKNKPSAKPNKHTPFPRTYLFCISILSIILAIAAPGIALSGEITFQWDENEQATGYTLYYGFESGLYDTLIDVGASTQHTVTGLISNQPYYFAVTAYNDYGESDFSQELVYEPGRDSTNQPPIADAGADQVVNEYASVTLNGSNSTDPDDGIDTFSWEQIEGPAIDLNDPRDEVTTFSAPGGLAAGTILTFNLTVSDYYGAQSQDSCTVTVNPVAIQNYDTVNITEALYHPYMKLLYVNATSNAPANSVLLTVWALIDGIDVELGELKYSRAKKLYSKVFKKIKSKPDYITVESSGGGIDTQPVP